MKRASHCLPALSLLCAIVLCFPLPAKCVTPLELTASNAKNGIAFGRAVAAAGNFLVIGAPANENALGAAYVFARTGSGWHQVAELTASDGADGDFFGFAVGISGNTVVVGAPDHAAGGNLQQGAVYIFVRPSTGWSDMTETAELTVADGQTGDLLGYSVAIQGDTVVGGAGNASPNGSTSEGAAYIFVEPNTGWATTSQFNAELAASDGSLYDRFGWSSAMYRDTVVIGAYGTNGYAGSAYVFVKPASGWSNTTQTAELTGSDAVPYSFFGWSVAISGNTICVGATQQDLSTGTGKAYVYREPSRGWTNMTQTAELTPSDGTADEEFGVSVSILNSTVAVGALNGAATQGAAYVFLEPSNGWRNETQSVKLTAPGGSESNDFGQSVLIAGQELIVGAPNTSIDDYAGAVYIF
jgi:FG-GAP repeat